MFGASLIWKRAFEGDFIMIGLKQLSLKSSIFSIIFSICLTTVSQAFAQKITDILVSGNQRVSEGTIRSYLPIEVGDDISTSALDKAIDRLFATSLFSDVDISTEDGLIKILVIENPIINRITVEGNDVLETDILITQLGIEPRRVYTKKVAIDGMQKLLEIYELSGRYGASVEPVIIELDNNRVDLIFEVDEGPLIKISSIQFEGNERYSDRKLKQVLKNYCFFPTSLQVGFSF